MLSDFPSQKRVGQDWVFLSDDSPHNVPLTKVVRLDGLVDLTMSYR